MHKSQRCPVDLKKTTTNKQEMFTVLTVTMFPAPTPHVVIPAH